MPGLNQRKLTRRAILCCSGALTVSALVASCSPKSTATPTPQPTHPPEAGEATTAPQPVAAVAQTADEILAGKPELIPGSPNHPRGWRTTFPDVPAGVPWKPPIVITESRRVDAATRYVGNDDINNNPMTRMYKELFGIEWKAAWTRVTPEEHAQKLNVAMASGDLPDLMENVSATLFAPLLEADMVQDITETYEAYASPWIKELLEWGDHIVWSYAEVDGRKMGWPHVEGAAEDEKVLLIRQDWLDKVGKEKPKTLTDIADVALAFKQANLGKGNTIGLLAGQNLVSWYASLDPIIGAHGTIPGSWIDDGEGGLTFGSIQPGMKDALKLLSQWYKDGVLASDFFTLGNFDTAKFVEGGQAGMWYCHGVARGGLGAMVNDPEARFTWAPIQAHPETGLRKMWWHNPCVSNIWVFRKGFEHVDKVIEQANFDAQWALKPEMRMHGFEKYNYDFLPDGSIDPASTEITFNRWAFGLVFCAGNNYPDPYKMRALINWRKEYREEVPREQWDAMIERMLEDPTGIVQMDDEIRLHLLDHTDEDTIKNRFIRLPTPTMVTSMASLNKLTDATFLGIITDEKPLSAFDEFVADWKAQGGEKITQEVNEWWKSKQ